MLCKRKSAVTQYGIHVPHTALLYMYSEVSMDILIQRIYTPPMSTL